MANATEETRVDQDQARVAQIGIVGLSCALGPWSDVDAFAQAVLYGPPSSDAGGATPGRAARSASIGSVVRDLLGDDGLDRFEAARATDQCDKMPVRTPGESTGCNVGSSAVRWRPAGVSEVRGGDPVDDPTLQTRLGVIVCGEQSVAKDLSAVDLGAGADLVLNLGIEELGQALATAWTWLVEVTVDYVAIIEDGPSGLGGVLLARLDRLGTNAVPGGRRPLAVIVSPGPESLESPQASRTTPAGLVSLSETLCWPPEDEVVRAYRSPDAGLTCAVGSLAASHGVASPMAALIKTVLCLEHRVLAPSPAPTAGVAGALPADSTSWEGTPFYLVPRSRTWFVNSDIGRRMAVLDLGCGVPPDRSALACTGLSASGAGMSQTTLDKKNQPNTSYGDAEAACCGRTQIVLAEVGSARNAPAYAPLAGARRCYLLPLAGTDEASLVAGLEALRERLEGDVSLEEIVDGAHRAYAAFASSDRTPAGPDRSPLPGYALGLVGHDRDELLAELGFAVEGLARAFATSRDWQTPRGSAFTVTPLGGQAVAFVYPGAFNSYVGLGETLLQHFPGLHERMAAITSDLSRAVAEQWLYPRHQRPVTPEILARDRERLSTDPVAMIESGTAFAIAHTMILRDMFGVHPDMALGYSLGEVSMLWAAGVWQNGDEAGTALRAAELFKTRLAGPKLAVREFWGVEPPSDAHAGREGDHVPADDLWVSYLLKAPAVEVQRCVEAEPKAYVTFVNLADEVVIAGDLPACQRVIDTLGCHALRVPSAVTIHADAMRSEYSALADLYSHPVAGRPCGDSASWASAGGQDRCPIRFYSAAHYAVLDLAQDALARAMALMSCQPVDFPRLVNRVYADGARVFVELGPMGTCTRWISRILRGKPHVVVAMNPTNVGDLEGVLGVLARLVTHRVPLDLGILHGALSAAGPAQAAVPGDLRSPVHDPSADAHPRVVSGGDAGATKGNADRAGDPVGVERARALPAAWEAEAISGAEAVRTSEAASTSAPAGTTGAAEAGAGAPATAVGIYEATRTLDALPLRGSGAQGHDAFLRMRADGQRGARSVIELQLAVAELMLGRPPKPKPLFGPDDLHEFAVGDVSRCLGPAFAVSRGNRLPRIPNGDLLLMSRVLDIEGRPAGLAASGKLSSEFDVTPNAWFYRGVRVGGGDRATDTLFPALPPYAVLMEMALQPCGFLSAYLGSPLQSPRADLYFRNLDGQGQVLRELDLRGKTVRDEVCLVSSTRSQGIILQKFTFALSCEGEPFYEGWASFGYFPEGALQRQVGLDNGATAENGATAQGQGLSCCPPSPLAARELPTLLLGTESTVPQLHLLEEVGVIPAGGNNGVGYLRARGRISPQDWYFQAHFYEDPVMPGSLGVEAVMQAMRAYGRAQYPAFSDTAVHQVPGRRFEWRYRGQVTPDDRAWWLDVHLSDVVRDGTSLVLVGDASVWKGQLRIYEMHNVAVQLDRDVTGVAR